MPTLGHAAAYLEVKGLTVRYGALEAVRGVSFRLREGEAITLIGPNGAGKTSVLRGILGLAQAEGEVFVFGRVLRPRSPEALLELGVVLVPEGRAIFPGLSVEDNLLLGGSFASAGGSAFSPTSSRCTQCSPGSGKGGDSWPGPSREGSSRCWPSAGP